MCPNCRDLQPNGCPGCDPDREMNEDVHDEMFRDPGEPHPEFIEPVEYYPGCYEG